MCAAMLVGETTQQQYHQQKQHEFAANVVSILSHVFPTIPATPPVLTTKQRHRIEVENEFLIKKVISLRQTIQSYDTAIAEFDDLTGRLAEQLQAAQATTGPAAGASDVEASSLREAVATLEEKVRHLERENELLRQAMVPLCLAINLVILCYFGWDHVQHLFPRALLSPPQMQAFPSRLTVRARRWVTGITRDAYRGLSVAAHHVMLIMS